MEAAAVERFWYLVKVGRAAFAEKDIATVVAVPLRDCATTPYLEAAQDCGRCC